MGNLVTETTLWSVCPLDIDSQGETEIGLQLFPCSSFRRPFTEVEAVDVFSRRVNPDCFFLFSKAMLFAHCVLCQGLNTYPREHPRRLC